MIEFAQLLELAITLIAAIIAYFKHEEAALAKQERQQIIDVFDPEKPDVDMPEDVPPRVYRTSAETIAFMQAGESPEDKIRIANEVMAHESLGEYDYQIKTARHLYHVYYGGVIGGAAF